MYFEIPLFNTSAILCTGILSSLNIISATYCKIDLKNFTLLKLLNIKGPVNIFESLSKKQDISNIEFFGNAGELNW